MIRDDKKIGRNIKAIRNANKKSYIDFAEDIGISQSYLEKIENGSRSAMDHVIENISKNTGFSFQEIKEIVNPVITYVKEIKGIEQTIKN